MKDQKSLNCKRCSSMTFTLTLTKRYTDPRWLVECAQCKWAIQIKVGSDAR